MGKKISFFIEKSFIGQFKNRLIRRARGGVVIDKKSSKNNFSKIQNIFRSINIKLPKYFRVFFIFGIAFAFISIHAYNFIQIKTEPFSEVDLQLRPKIFQTDLFNTAVYIYSEVDGYKYIDYVALVSHGESEKIAQVSPLFKSNKYESSLRSFLNEVDPGEGSIMYELNDALSGILGVRVDRYIIAEKNDLLNYFKNNSVLYTFSEYDIWDTTEISTNDYVKKQSVATNDLFQNSFNIFNKYRLYWSAPSMAKAIKTDMTRSELLSFFNRFNTDTRIQLANFDSSYAIIIESPSKSLEYNPNLILIDEKVTILLGDLSILSEQVELEIYNASNIRGLASGISRELKNQGVNIVKFGNYFEDENETTLHINDLDDLDRYKNTINSIRQSLRGDVKIVEGEYPYNKTGDLILVLAN